MYIMYMYNYFANGVGGIDISDIYLSNSAGGVHIHQKYDRANMTFVFIFTATSSFLAFTCRSRGSRRSRWSRGSGVMKCS